MFTLKRPVSVLSASALIFLLFWSPFVSAQQNDTRFDSKAFYTAFASNNMQHIQQQLDLIALINPNNRDAFEGALMMKKSSLIKGASQKLREFNAGRKKLEHMISMDSNNAELRFLRLMIQEKAPKMLKYDAHLEADHQFIIANYRNLSEVVRKVINDYSNSSKILSPQDF